MDITMSARYKYMMDVAERLQETMYPDLRIERIRCGSVDHLAAQSVRGSRCIQQGE